MTSPPVRPDRETGEPRPPAAPLPIDDMQRAQSTRTFDLPIPEDHGPVLEIFQEARRDSWKMSAYTVGFMLVPVVIADWGFSWASAWYMWAILLGFPLIFVVQGTTRMAAGAEWLMIGKRWVLLYELTLISIKTGGVGPICVELVDRNGNAVRASSRTFAANPKLWDLVYNGIRYSYRNGAKANKRTRDELSLDTYR